jgi:hypothetical protein
MGGGPGWLAGMVEMVGGVQLMSVLARKAG